jgi:hypothetical protein
MPAEQHEPIGPDGRAGGFDEELPIAEVGVETPPRHEADVVLRHQRRSAARAEAVHQRQLVVEDPVEIEVEIAGAGEVTERVFVEVGVIELDAFEDRALGCGR